jgi:uncharacterized protein (DUF433 family)
MATATIDINELLEVREGFRQGRPCLRGTGITVHTIAADYLDGATPAQILEDFPHATIAGIMAALAYYEAHREEVDADFERDYREAIESAHALGIEIV